MAPSYFEIPIATTSTTSHESITDTLIRPTNIPMEVDILNGILLNAVPPTVSPTPLSALYSDSSSLTGNASFHFHTKEHTWSRGSAHFEPV